MSRRRGAVPPRVGLAALLLGALGALDTSCAPADPPPGDDAAQVPRPAGDDVAAHVVTVPDVVADDMPGPVARALRAAREAVVREPDSPRAWGQLGSLCDAHHRYVQAAICYRQAMRLKPDEFLWPYLLGVVLDYQGAPVDETVAAFEQALELSEAYPPLHYRFGAALMRAAEHERARASFERAVQLDEDFAMARRGLGQALLASGEPAAALPHLERAYALAPQDGAVHAALARAHALLGDRATARTFAESGRELTGDFAVPDPIRHRIDSAALDPTSCERRATAALREGHWDAARTDLLRLVEMVPDDADHRHHLARCHQLLGDVGAAIEQYGHALRLDEGLDAARRELAILLHDEGRPADAVPHYQRLLEGQPDDAALRGRLGLALAMTGDYAGGLVEFERAAALAPPDAQLHHNTGMVLTRLDRLVDAELQFESALALDPESAGTLFNLGRVRELLGRQEQALDDYRASARLDPGGLAARRLTELGQQPP